MKFKKVEAEAFGPLKSDVLEFSDGLNVVWGPNEAAKSSWHAAMYAALCGRRRGRGSVGRDEGFRKRHQPWHSDEWAVGAVIELDDGRTVRLSHDLAGKHSDVIDAQLGRPIDDEIVNDGAPDGALWVGLDRTSFLSTACVRQADIAAVVDDPDGIRDLMQKAASTLGGEVTAAQAVDAISSFRKEAVGVDRANAVKPLRKAVEAVAEAQHRLELVRSSHDEYLHLVAATDQAAKRVDQTRSRLERSRTLLQCFEAQRAIAEFETISALAARCGAHDSLPDVDDSTLDHLSTLLARWRSMPSLGSPSGPSLPEIDAALDAMPPEPIGPVTIHLTVAEAAAEVDRARRSLEVFPEVPPVVGPDVSLLEEAERMAAVAVSPEPSDDGASDALEAAKSAHLDRQRRVARRRLAFGVAAGSALGGLALLLAGVPIGAIVLFIIAAVVSGAGLGMSIPHGSQDLAALEGRVLSHHTARERHSRATAEASDWLERRGFVADPVAIREQRIARSTADSERARWQERSAELRGNLDASVERLREALAEQGIAVVDVDESLNRYRRTVAANADAADQRRQIPLLLEQRRECERELAVRSELGELKQAMSTALLALKPHLDLGEPIDIDAVGRRVERVVADMRNTKRALVERAGLVSRLDAMLDGRTVADLEQAAESAARVLATSGVLAEPEGQCPTERDIERLGSELSEAERSHAELLGRLGSVDAETVDVAAAEAGMAAAERELRRVQQLSEVLDLTAQHLSSAEAEAFRRVAPLVAEGVSEHIGAVTGGRYVEALVDPEALEVTVRDSAGRYRPASALSHGTTEQVFLLLRLAMVEVLTKPGERCPVLIDDATVHADDQRTEALLTLLHRASQDRQVVLFTQETAVLEWAQERLGVTDRLIELPAAS